MQEVLALSIIGIIGAVEREPAAAGAYESCVVGKRKTSMKLIVICDERAIGVDDPWRLGTGVLAHSRVPGAAHGTQAGEVVGEREAGDDLS
jgi:hypothetical protein